MNLRRAPGSSFSCAVWRATALRNITSASSPPPPPPKAFPLKNVTKSNFEATLSELQHYVRACDFVSIDLEMTGITSTPWRESFEFDRSDVRYLKVKDSADKFAVFQFGVCPFRWDNSNQYFIAHPHNFYVFPRQELREVCPNDFLCQTTSVEFLLKHQFDFNMCIREGISYLSREQEKEAIDCVNSAYEGELTDSRFYSKNARDIPIVSIPDVLFSERMKMRLSEWRNGLFHNNGATQFEGTSKDSKQQMEVIFFKMRPALLLKGFTSHQLKLIQSVLRKNFEDLSYVTMNKMDSCPQPLVVYTDSEEEKNLLMMQMKDECRKADELKIQAAVGFRHVIDMLSAEQKLIVGHNCFLDFAHIHRKFIGTLPWTADEFVSSVNEYFPHIIDTKILLNADYTLEKKMKKSRTSLSSAFAQLCPQVADNSKSPEVACSSYVKVEVEVNDSRSSSWNPGAKHEAGYDAFMTGCVFAQACSYLGITFKSGSASENLAHHEKLKQHINRLYLSWSQGDVIDLRTGSKIVNSSPSLELKKRYPKIMFENVVIMWGFPPKLKAREIKECISKVFGPAGVLSVFHLDETAVFLLFSKSELVSDFLILKDAIEKNNDDPISVVHPLAKILEGGDTCAADYDTYRDICSSPISKILFADQAKAVGIKWKTKFVNCASNTVNSKNQEVLDSNGASDTSPKSIRKTKLTKTDTDTKCEEAQPEEIIDSLYTSHVDQIRTANF